MSVSAFDPSTWGDEPDSDAEPLDFEPVVASDIDPDHGAAFDTNGLRSELADLRELERSTQAQLDKASATVTAAKVELSRLRRRIAEIEQDIADAGSGA